VRQAQEAERRVSRAKEWAKLQASTNGRYGNNRTRSYMNGYTATATATDTERWKSGITHRARPSDYNTVRTIETKLK